MSSKTYLNVYFEFVVLSKLNKGVKKLFVKSIVDRKKTTMYYVSFLMSVLCGSY